ncbi:TIGR03619 family F420-dependent LLM class oxidoreductase [Streptomyces cavernicola]|uniref:TIGR03619 family F420-dependent LLM class oxidoreductase n=1 Tax=Streptomyces cavernicola TaxID=3043613 RepID=A0ABT6SKP1_9ACTN|nr:TIGR03619 family F420-dependent LLM class oxidoreductase [Streptomyces sp. B-S-A6]MDI3408766.1 TIGR03619 family F420-dependent LLM class oxidoreductase [Streptomyces sp. B-S-A6]
MIRLGMMAPFADGLITSGGFLRDLAGTLEECGVESLWTVEHVAVAESYEPLYPYAADGRIPGSSGAVPMPDPLETIAFIAGSCDTLRFGTAMMVAPLHSPVVLAKRAATLDRLTGGRLLLGLGIGWQKEEYAAVGVPYRDRGRRLEEGIGAMRALWSSSPASYTGVHCSFEDLHSLPRPASGAVPVVLGGNSDPAVRRAGRIGDGWFPYTITPEDFARQADLLRDCARRAGRAEDSVEITVWPGSCSPERADDPSWVGRYVAAGAGRLVLSPRIGGADGLAGPRGLDALREQIDRYRSEVLEKLS